MAKATKVVRLHIRLLSEGVREAVRLTYTRVASMGLTITNMVVKA